MTPNTTYLKDYLPPAYSFDSVDLTFDLSEQKTQVKVVYDIHRKDSAASDAPLELFGSDVKLVSIQLKKELLTSSEYELTNEQLILKNMPSHFQLTIQTEINPAENKTLSGLYVSRSIFCTQCEAEGFRRMTYFPDRPDVLSKYTTTIIADKKHYPILLSNGNLVEQGEGERGRHWMKWEDPFSKPSYLFALVAGDLDFIEDKFITKTGRSVTLKIFCEKGDAEKCHHAMECLKKAMRWDEEKYGREYDLDIYMIVAINDFNMGAMENKGLNVFNSRYILVDPETATDQDYENVLIVIGHEYFHNWTGNRITCRDWFQLSLKEGLTVFREHEFTEDMTSRALARIAQVNFLRTHQFLEDAGPLAHPVQPQSYIEINNFYTATIYHKGSEVIRMMKRLIGEEVFRKGMDIYFERYDGQAVTIEEFVSSMEMASGKDLKQFRLWYTQAGTPDIRINAHYHEATQNLQLTVTQACPPTPGQVEKKPFHFPLEMAVLNESGEQDFLLEIKEPEQTFTLKNIVKPGALSLFRGFSAPVKWQDNSDDTAQTFLLLHDTDPVSRWDAWQKWASKALLAVVKDPHSSEQDSASFIKIIQAFLNQESDRGFLSELLILPNETYLGEQMSVIDVEGIHQAREKIIRLLGESLKAHWQRIYEENQTPGLYSTEREAVIKRRLKNISLSYLLASKDPWVMELAYQQFVDADNMTDVLGALSPMVHQEHELAQKALKEFYIKWHRDALVMDKWLAIQAICKRPGTLKRIQALMQDPVFDPENPNRVRALFGTFSRENRAQFHAMNGEGYIALKEEILKADRFNPQLSARLFEPFTQWRRFDEGRQLLMRTHLEAMLKEKKLSKDLYEVVSKVV